jgi:hypothetical protein
MKYCPQCNRQFTEPWLTFCSEDGTMLIEELSPPVDPNWNPVIREPQVETPSERETQWLPREPSMPPAWVAPDERPPMPQPWGVPDPPPAAPAWQPPPPPPRPAGQNQTMAIASMITGILGLMFGCFGPIPGVAAVILGYIALQQIKKSPATTGGKPMAIIGIVTGSLAIFFYGLLFLWFILAGVLGNL